jgi:hypothetical protein
MNHRTPTHEARAPQPGSDEKIPEKSVSLLELNDGKQIALKVEYVPDTRLPDGNMNCSSSRQPWSATSEKRGHLGGATRSQPRDVPGSVKRWSTEGGKAGLRSWVIGMPEKKGS